MLDFLIWKIKLYLLTKKRLKLSSLQLQCINRYGAAEHQSQKYYYLERLRQIRDTISTVDMDAIKTKGMMNDRYR